MAKSKSNVQKVIDVVSNPTPVSNEQWKKVVKALVYASVSGFLGGVLMSLMAAMQNGGVNTDSAFLFSLLTAGVVGGVNGLLVYVKQIFTVPEDSGQ